MIGFGFVDQVRKAAGTVEEAVLGVDVKVNEGLGHIVCAKKTLDTRH